MVEGENSYTMYKGRGIVWEEIICPDLRPTAGCCHLANCVTMFHYVLHVFICSFRHIIFVVGVFHCLFLCFHVFIRCKHKRLTCV